LNPSGADRNAERAWLRLEPAMRRRFPDLELHCSTRPGELTLIAATIASRGAPALVIAAGGDGTSHEVINGLMRDCRPINPAVRLAWLPLGSGNDLARTLGFADLPGPFGLDEPLAPAAIDAGCVAWRDPAGHPRTTAFGNSITVGVSTDALRLAGARGKAFGGKLAYFVAAAQALLRHRPRMLDVTLDGRSETGPAWLVSVTNGPAFGAGMRIAPEALLDDGVFDVVRITARSRLGLLSLLPRVYWGGHRSDPRVRSSRAKSIVIDTKDPIDFEADGELYHGLPPLSISLGPLALAIVRPARPLDTLGIPLNLPA
jgi:YegS/Rv2252/BmrU family lipid kinase